MKVIFSSHMLIILFHIRLGACLLIVNYGWSGVVALHYSVWPLGEMEEAVAVVGCNLSAVDKIIILR